MHLQYNFRGKYDSGEDYSVKDVVSYQPTVNDPIKYYMCLSVHDGALPVSPSPSGDNSNWGIINTLSNFPQTVDSFLYRVNIQANDKVDIARINELTLKTTLTTAEQDELSNLIAKHRNKLFQAEDINAIQDSLSNLQIFFKDKVEGYLNNSVASIQGVKDSALAALENKKNNLDLYLDSTTAGALRVDLGVMSDLTTADKTSLVKAVNEVKGTTIGTLSNLKTVDKTSIVNALNEVRNGQLQDIPSGTDILTLKDGRYFGTNLVNAPNSDKFKIEISTASSNSYKTYEATQLISNQKWIQIASLHPTLGTLIHFGWVEMLTDKAPTWSMMPMQNGATAFAVGSEPYFTKIGKVVYIKSVLTNITNVNTIVCTLPAGYRPSLMSHNFLAPIISISGVGRFARFTIGIDGTIKMEYTNDGVYNASHYFQIHTSFVCN